MKRIEKTKENIKVSNLDERTRKSLFNKFINAGGEIIDEKKEKSKNFIEFDRDVQKQYKHQLEKLYKKPRKSKPKKKPPEKKSLKSVPVKTPVKPVKERNPGRIRLFFNRQFIKFRLYSLGVTELNGQYLTPKFLDNFNSEYKAALIEMQTIFIDIFMQKKRIGKRITDQLDKFDPIYFELIELVSEVFNRTTIIKILEQYLKFPDIPIKAIHLKDPLIEILKKLHPINSYKEYLLFALERSLDLQMRYDKKKSSGYSSKRKQVRNNIFVIFNKLYPCLYWLFCYYEGRVIQPGELEEAISISLPGQRKRPEAPSRYELPQIESTISDDDDEDEEAIPNDVKKGLKLIKRLNIKKLRETYDREGQFKHINDSDKVLITYLLFLEFDREYSFILTTNKIKYNIFTGSSGKLDYKAKLTNIYNELGKCIENFRDYSNIIHVHDKVRLEKPISNTQFIEYSNRLTAIEKERAQIGKEARIMTKAFFERLAEELRELIDDMKGSQKIIANSDDRLIFDTQIEGMKKLSKKKIFDAFVITYYYILALVYRLSSEGDLSGELEFKNGEKTIFEFDISNGKSTNGSNTDDARIESIIEELEDFI